MSLRLRALLAGVLLTALGVGSTAAGLGGRPRPAAPAVAATLLSGDIVRDRAGRPILDDSGRPLRVGRDGVVVDSKGRRVRDGAGRPVRVGPGVTATPEAVKRLVTRDRKPKRSAPRRPPRRRPSRRPGKPEATASEPIVVGVAYQKPDAMFPQVSYDAGLLPDGAAIGRATIEYVNATGGVGGRPMKLRPYMFDASTGRDYDAIRTEVCEFFAAPPRPVFVTANNSAYDCLDARGLAFVGSAPWSESTKVLADLRHTVVPGGTAYDRWPAPFIRELDDRAFFDGARVGLGYPRGWRGAADAVTEMKEALRAAGANVVAEAGIDVPRNANDIAPAVRDIANAVVRFRVARVDRVVAVDVGMGIGLFMQFAEAQQYRPRYGVNTTNAPTSLIANVPHEQLRGAIGIGFAPLIDVDAAQDPGAPATREECIGIFRRAGIPVGGRNLFGAFASLSFCDSILMSRAAMERSGRATPDGLIAGMEGLSRPSGLPLATRIDATNHDGASAYRLLAYEERCGCFAYRGGNRPLP